MEPLNIGSTLPEKSRGSSNPDSATDNRGTPNALYVQVVLHHESGKQAEQTREDQCKSEWGDAANHCPRAERLGPFCVVSANFGHELITGLPAFGVHNCNTFGVFKTRRSDVAF
jgi:hypothetical protein